MAVTPNDVASLARSCTKLAIKTLKTICGDPRCPPGSRVVAAGMLLDRGWGKPDQRIEFTAKIADQMSDQELNAELERLGKLIELKAEPEPSDLELLPTQHACDIENKDEQDQ